MHVRVPACVLGFSISVSSFIVPFLIKRSVTYSRENLSIHECIFLHPCLRTQETSGVSDIHDAYRWGFVLFIHVQLLRKQANTSMTPPMHIYRYTHTRTSAFERQAYNFASFACMHAAAGLHMHEAVATCTNRRWLSFSCKLYVLLICTTACLLYIYNREGVQKSMKQAVTNSLNSHTCASIYFLVCW
jgi:hypothetical protein